MKLSDLDYAVLMASFRLDPNLERGTRTSLELIDSEGVEASDEEVEDSIKRLDKIGWLVFEFTKSTMDIVSRTSRPKHYFRLTPRGQAVALSRLASSIDQGFWHRFHSMHWSTWGGLAAIVAAAASVLAAYFSFLALDK